MKNFLIVCLLTALLLGLACFVRTPAPKVHPGPPSTSQRYPRR